MTYNQILKDEGETGQRREGMKDRNDKGENLMKERKDKREEG